MKLFSRSWINHFSFFGLRWSHHQHIVECCCYCCTIFLQKKIQNQPICMRIIRVYIARHIYIYIYRRVSISFAENQFDRSSKQQRKVLIFCNLLWWVTKRFWDRVELIYLLSISSSTPKLTPSSPVFGLVCRTGMQIYTLTNKWCALILVWPKCFQI